MLLSKETDMILSAKVQKPPVPDAANAELPDYSDAQLVELAKKKVRWASEHLVTRYYPKALSLAYQMCNGNKADASDVTQQAFLNMLGKLHTFKEQASFKTWFYRILVNTGLDARRKRHRWLRLVSFPRWKSDEIEKGPVSPMDLFPDEKATNSPEAAWQSAQIRKEIQQALERLPEKQQLVFQMKVLEEMSIADISDILQMAQGTVKSHLYRATQYMRKKLTHWSEGE